jgi:cell division protein FtsB
MKKNIKKHKKINFGNLFLCVSIVLTVFMLLSFLYGENGFFDLLRFKKEKHILIQENMEIESKNLYLKKLITRAKSDPKFIKYIARKELGMIGKDEIILKFEKQKMKPK